MGKVERRTQALLGLLRANGGIDVETAQRELGVSGVTVRRLLMKLEAENKIVRTRGGAIPAEAFRYSFLKERAKAREEKFLLGAIAADMVQSGDSIFLDSGTTILNMAEFLALRLRSGDLSEILVVTHSLCLFDVLGAHAKMIIAGGEARPDHRDVCGSVAERTLSDYHVDKAFFGADGLHPAHGLMCVDEQSYRINRIVMARAAKKYVLVDSGKFNQTSLLAYAPFEAIDKILTDAGVDRKTFDLLRSKGCEIEIVPSGDGRGQITA